MWDSKQPKIMHVQGALVYGLDAHDPTWMPQAIPLAHWLVCLA